VANVRGAKYRGLEFWRVAVERMKQGENTGTLAKELGVDRRGLYRWRQRLDPERQAEPTREREAVLAKEVERLKRALAEKVLELDFFQRCLAQNRGATPGGRKHWREGIYDQIRGVMSVQGSLSVERMCQLAPVSRAGYYRSLQESRPVEEDMAVRSAVQEVVLEHRRRYGYRRVTPELRRRGFLVNHKRVARIMREDHLLAIGRRQFVVTTESGHGWKWR